MSDARGEMSAILSEPARPQASPSARQSATKEASSVGGHELRERRTFAGYVEHRARKAGVSHRRYESEVRIPIGEEDADQARLPTGTLAQLRDDIAAPRPRPEPHLDVVDARRRNARGCRANHLGVGRHIAGRGARRTVSLDGRENVPGLTDRERPERTGARVLEVDEIDTRRKRELCLLDVAHADEQRDGTGQSRKPRLHGGVFTTSGGSSSRLRTR